MRWPDEACNPTNRFGNRNTNAQPDADAWATWICQQNGYAKGIRTGNKGGRLQRAVSMCCASTIPCQPTFEMNCKPLDQTNVEVTCSN